MMKDTYWKQMRQKGSHFLLHKIVDFDFAFYMIFVSTWNC